MRITVVTPTYNEAENLPGLVSSLFALPLDLRLLVVDDSSTDGTAVLAYQLAVEHPGRMETLRRPRKSGLRAAYLSGFRRALAGNAKAIGQMDADLSHEPGVLVEMARRLEACDMVLGSRYIPGGSVDRAWAPWRKGLSAFGNLYARVILGLAVSDSTSGYRLWRRETLASMPLERVRASGYVFQVEMAYLADCLKYAICEVPIYFANRRRGKSKMTLAIQAEAALRVLQVWWNYRDLRRRGPTGRRSA